MERFGGGQREVDQRLRVRVAHRGARAHHLHRTAVLHLVEVGQVAVAGQHVAGALEPVLGERTLEAAHDRAADAHVGVAPVVGVLGVAGPLLGDPDPAGEADLAVHDQQLAVRAVLEPADRVRLGRAKPAEGDARLAHLLDQPAVHLGAADGVDQDVALHARVGAVAERLGHLDRDVALPVGVGEEVDRLLGLADGLEVGGEDLVAVDQEVDVVAVRHRRAGERLGRPQEARLGRRPPRRAACSRGRPRGGGGGCRPRTRPPRRRPRPAGQA